MGQHPPPTKLPSAKADQSYSSAIAAPQNQRASKLLAQLKNLEAFAEEGAIARRPGRPVPRGEHLYSVARNVRAMQEHSNTL